ncbi:MAG: MFS transporter [Candidatus Baldrarchaeia archaeon]
MVYDNKTSVYDVNRSREKFYKPLAVTSALIFLAIFLLGIAIGVQRAILSIYASEFVSIGLQIGIIIALFAAFEAIIGLPSGILTDFMGRKSVFVIGSLLSAIGSFVIAVSTSYFQLLFGSILLGTGAGMSLVAAMTALGDIAGTEEKGESIGKMEFSVYIGLGIGAISAGFISQQFSIRVALYFAAITSLFFLVVSLTMRETRGFGGHSRRSQIASFSSRILKNRRLMTVYAIGHLAKFGDGFMWAFLPIFLHNFLGLSLFEIGIVAGSLTLAWALMMPIGGKIADAIGRKIPCMLGLLINAISLIAVAFSPPSLPFVLIAVVSTGLGMGLYYPVLPVISMDVAAPHYRGAALGLYRSFRDMGWLLGPLILGFLIDFWGIYDPAGFRASLLLISVSLIVGMIAFSLRVKETRPGWPTFSLSVNHILTVEKVAEKVESAVTFFAQCDMHSMIEEIASAKKMEETADMIKREIMRRLSESVLEPPDRGDFVNLTDVVDRIAGYLIGGSRRLTLVDPYAVPPEIKEDFVSFASGVRRICRLVRDAFIALRENPEVTLDIVKDIEETERNLDDLHHSLLRKMRILSDVMKISEYLMVWEFVESMEMSADMAEEAGDLIRMIAVKHFM